MFSVRSIVLLFALIAVPLAWAAPTAMAADEGGHTPAGTHGAAGNPGNGAHPTEGDADPLRADPDLAIWTAVIFGVLLIVLGKFAWGPIVVALGEREQHIANNIAAAEAKHEEAKELLAQHAAQLAGAADEVRGLLEEARRDAEHTKGQIVAEAKAAAKAEHDRALRDLDHAIDAAKKQLAEQSADLIVALAGKVIREKITPEHQSRIAREALARFASAEPSRN